MSLATMAALAVVLGMVLQQRIADRALRIAASSAQVVGAVVGEHTIPRAELAGGLTPPTLRHLDQLLAPGRLDGAGILKIVLFDGRGRPIYDSERPVVPAGPQFRPGPDVLTALSGRPVRRLAKGTDHDGRGTTTLSVHAPIESPGAPTPPGAFEVFFDYAPAAAAVRQDVTTMWAIVAVGFVVLWLMLFRLVRGAAAALRRQVETNRRQAERDALTGLPNRTLLFERLEEAVAEGPAILVQADLDRFREINDTLGHDHGDQLLLEVGHRLRATLPGTDLVARVGGDDFAVLRAGSDDEGEAAELAALVAEVLGAPASAGGTTVVIDAAVGVALAPLHAIDAAGLARRVEVAMYEAKRRHGGVEIYDATRDTHNRGRLELLGELDAALRRRELVIAYQPKIELATGELSGAEALVRWRHPHRGLLSPAAFIPAAELTSLVHPLTLYVLDEALRRHRGWAKDGLVVPVAVNLAGPCVMDVDLPAAVERLLDEHRVAPALLTLEISEGTVLADPERALRVLGQLAALGVTLSLDDFGTGQTSLGQLRQLPLQEMKIDRSLVIGDPRMLSSVVEIAHRFDLRAVGEGVEDEDIASALVEAGCDEAQGFLYARPMWADELLAWDAARTMGPDATSEAAGLPDRRAGARR